MADGRNSGPMKALLDNHPRIIYRWNNFSNSLSVKPVYSVELLFSFDLYL